LNKNKNSYNDFKSNKVKLNKNKSQT
jgi:hypothetical protein